MFAAIVLDDDIDDGTKQEQIYHLGANDNGTPTGDQDRASANTPNLIAISDICIEVI
jgi:hypothetical protein